MSLSYVHCRFNDLLFYLGLFYRQVVCKAEFNLNTWVPFSDIQCSEKVFTPFMFYAHSSH